MSSKGARSNKERRQFRQMVIEPWQDSGMSISKFCKADGPMIRSRRARFKEERLNGDARGAAGFLARPACSCHAHSRRAGTKNPGHGCFVGFHHVL